MPPQTPQSQGKVHPQALLHNIQPGQTVPPQTPIRGGIPSIPYSRAFYTLSPVFIYLNTVKIAVIGQLPPPKKQWYDKVADALLGDDTATTGPQASSRYALICEKCFTHNGLVKEDQWEDAQYLCPKCGHFNKSMRARKALHPSTIASPVSTATTTSTIDSSAPPTSSSIRSSVVPSTTPSDPPSQDTEPHHHVPTSPVMTKKRIPEKSPLSESTVLVEKSDAEEMDIDS
ncbi:hypothetical protein Clacol_009494 [Clathrus columnatus]|uniref:Endoplasmic reticulum junction formation protein lunapark n=1 Tax=Clathrus columnatus TaxID=1419009 RepID=A0AAV5AQ98_9AGAM|nr:hypothetical protein Clacol_009494 [Clathrus columnatus]